MYDSNQTSSPSSLYATSPYVPPANPFASTQANSSTVPVSSATLQLPQQLKVSLRRYAPFLDVLSLPPSRPLSKVLLSDPYFEPQHQSLNQYMQLQRKCDDCSFTLFTIMVFSTITFENVMSKRRWFSLTKSQSSTRIFFRAALLPAVLALAITSLTPWATNKRQLVTQLNFNDELWLDRLRHYADFLKQTKQNRREQLERKLKEKREGAGNQVVTVVVNGNN